MDMFFDNLLLSSDEIKLHNYEKCEEIVSKKIQKYLRSHFRVINLSPPRITVNYDMVWHPSSLISDSTGNFVARKIDAEAEAMEIYKIISSVWELLSYNERVYFTEVLLYKKSENYAIDQMKDITRYLLKQVKESCIIKLAMAFGEGDDE